MPLDSESGQSDQWLAMVLDFFVYSFDLWPSLILSSTIIASFFASRSLYFDDKFQVGSCILVILILGLAVAAVQCLYNKIGFFIIEKDVLREGNDQLLNSLEEGVIIVEENNSEVCFLNTAA